MADTRKANRNWLIETTVDGRTPSADALLATIMDLRDELQAIRRLIACPNVARGFRAMQSVDRRLARGVVTRRPAAKKRGARG